MKHSLRIFVSFKGALHERSPEMVNSYDDIQPCTLKRSNHQTVKNKDLKSRAIYDRLPQVIAQPVTAHSCLPLWGLGRLPGSDGMPDKVLLRARSPRAPLRSANASPPRADERTRAGGPYDV